MDLSKLVNSDTPSQQRQQIEATRSTTASTLHYAQQAAIDRPSYHVNHGQPLLEGRASVERPHPGQLETLQPPPSLTGQYMQHASRSPSSYIPPPQQLSPFSTRSASRPSSNGYEIHPPATPIQLQPPANALTQSHAISPTPSSHRSFTPQSVHHSPMPTLQYGLPSAASTFGPPPPLPYSNSRSASHHYDSHNSPQQYRVPLGPPSHPGLSPANRRVSVRSGSDREGSADVSPKTQPMSRTLSVGSGQGSTQQELGSNQGGQALKWNSHSNENITSQQPIFPHGTSLTNNSTFTSSASPTSIPSSNTTRSNIDRPTPRRSATMSMSHLLSDESTPPEVVKHEVEDSTRARIANGVNNAENKKRAPEDEISASRPTKKERTRRHLERPVWAQLSTRNPRSSGKLVQKDAKRVRAAAAAAQNDVGTSQKQPRAGHVDHSNGVSVPATIASINLEKPWLNELPYDMDLIQARQVLGAWEKSIKWNTPYPDMLRAIQDWLLRNLQSHQDIVQDASIGSIEIEAKIGRLVKPSNGQRAGLPVMNMTLLDPAVNRDYRFESELEETDFKILNEFLNKTLVDSMQPGRQRMEYKRVAEKDSFAHLSPAGHALLPKSLHRQASTGRELKLRSTTHVKTGETTARIVKVGLADLHIYNPLGYDCRISMNAEVNMMRPGLHPDELITPATEEKPVPPSRTKDRLSYKHLAYQIDLTNVNVVGLAAKYEMEVEVDAQALSSQIQLMADGKAHAFTDVVSGFLDNITFLMRQRQPGN